MTEPNTAAIETDMQTCETCPREHPIEDMLMMEDCWICPVCYAEFKAEFDICEHDWEPHINTHGDEGRYCRKCTGFVMDEDTTDD